MSTPSSAFSANCGGRASDRAIFAGGGWSVEGLVAAVSAEHGAGVCPTLTSQASIIGIGSE